MLGLKRGTVTLCPHEAEWERTAEATAVMLRTLFGEAASDVQHVGSTAVRGIRAKPILDLAVAVRDFDAVRGKIPLLEEHGVRFRGEERPGEWLFVMGDFDADMRTHHIHAVGENSDAWRNYLRFRDYLNAHPDRAAAYGRLKEELAERFADDRARYTEGKRDFIAGVLEEARTAEN